jgi:hypothetical protein
VSYKKLYKNLLKYREPLLPFNLLKPSGAACVIGLAYYGHLPKEKRYATYELDMTFPVAKDIGARLGLTPKQVYNVLAVNDKHYKNGDVRRKAVLKWLRTKVAG